MPVPGRSGDNCSVESLENGKFRQSALAGELTRLDCSHHTTWPYLTAPSPGSPIHPLIIVKADDMAGLCSTEIRGTEGVRHSPSAGDKETAQRSGSLYSTSRPSLRSYKAHNERDVLRIFLTRIKFRATSPAISSPFPVTNEAGQFSSVTLKSARNFPQFTVSWRLDISFCSILFFTRSPEARAGSFHPSTPDSYEVKCLNSILGNTEAVLGSSEGLTRYS
ncbi:hypothetical protein RRG08_021432 [Elysia crispata]|uniref:Uncharacterized protein n=1 Tax=Elysia crispata TaxID=231223 RepID=A0AAE1DSU2_9GAST|nr:hypothetical protein RRG08_021432 [Elysia crispata]